MVSPSFPFSPPLASTLLGQRLNLRHLRYLPEVLLKEKNEGLVAVPLAEMFFSLFN